MNTIKEWLLGLYVASTVVSTVAFAGHDDIITRLAVENARISPDEAIALVTKHYPGTLKEFRVEDDEDELIYEINLIDPDAKEEIELEVSAQSGKIVREDRDALNSWFSFRNISGKKKYQYLLQNKITLQSAIAEAQKIEPGVLIEAELEQEKGVVFFEIKMITDKGKRKVIVDLDSGKPIPVTRYRH